MRAVHSSKQIGAQVRAARRAEGITQVELAGLAGTGVRFIADLERGKDTAEMGKVLQVLQVLGVKLMLETRRDA